jgi:hypothetical protein
MPGKTKQKNKSIISKLVNWITKNIWLFIVVLLAIAVFFVVTDLFWNWWDWTEIMAIATWILAAGVGVAIWQAAHTKSQAEKQSEVSRNSMKAQIAVELFEMLRHANILDTFRKIYDLEPADVRRVAAGRSKTDVVLRQEIGGVLDKIELLGALVHQGIIDEHLAIEVYGGHSVLKCWYQLGEDYIKKVRARRGLFCKYVEDLAARTFNYQRNSASKEEWICFSRGKSDKLVNLIQYYIDHPDLQPKFRD